MKLFIGLMSGTSMDGIDAALVDVDRQTLVTGITYPYRAEVRQCIERVLQQEKIKPALISQLNSLIGQDFGAAVLELLRVAKIPSQQVIAIGSHGQTISHDPTADIPYTMQLGCAHTIAELTGLTVVADFRTRDMVLGGQGAPFAPLYHRALFAGCGHPLAVVNIGGIANVTYLNQTRSAVAVYGYDIGPGNCLMDLWIQKQLSKPYDANGAWAASGQVIEPLLSELLADRYFKLSHPKSIGKEYFSYAWLSRHVLPEYAAKDVQATLLALTAISISESIKMSGLNIQHVAVCGGGVHNIALQQKLSELLPETQVESTQGLGVDPDFMEAMMCAWLAEKAINHTPVDLTQITGASKSAILGAIYPSGIDKGNSHRV